MKKIITILTIVVLVIACIFSFTGCKNEEKLVVATNAAFAPFEYKEGSEFKGIDMEIAQYLADELGMELEIQDMEFDGVISAVQSGTCDIAMAGLTINSERQKAVDFCEPYYNASQLVITKKYDTSLDGLTTAAEIEAVLSGKKIGVQRGTTGEFYTAGDEDWGFDGVTDQCITYDNGSLAVIDLINNQLDYVVIDNMPATNLVEKNSNFVKLINISLTEEEYAFAINKNNTELKEKVNEAMEKYKESGDFQKLLDKYFG